MLTNISRELGPTRNLGHQSSASVAEYHAAQFIAETFAFFRVGRVAKTLGQFKELLLLALFGFDVLREPRNKWQG